LAIGSWQLASTFLPTANCQLQTISSASLVTFANRIVPRFCMNRSFYFLLLGLAIGWSSCQKSKLLEEKEQENDQEIQAYITRKGINATKTASGLYYAITTPSGSTRVPVLGERVTFHYVVTRLMDEVIIDSSRVAKNRPATLIAGIYPVRIPTGLIDGLSLLHEGDKAVLLLPSQLAYGGDGTAALLPYSTIRYDINVLKIRSEDEQINDYVAANNLRVDSLTTSGLRFTLLQRPTATADTVKATDTQVAVTYVGKLLDGTMFDPDPTRTNATTSSATFNLTNANSTIKGFREGLLKMRVGDKARFIFPSSIGYGTTGSGTKIAPYTPLVFEVTVTSATQ
jgi:FKBP-type peptidyl-prolyl cis-trans isomerase